MTEEATTADAGASTDMPVETPASANADLAELAGETQELETMDEDLQSEPGTGEPEAAG